MSSGTITPGVIEPLRESIALVSRNAVLDCWLGRISVVVGYRIGDGWREACVKNIEEGRLVTLTRKSQSLHRFAGTCFQRVRGKPLPIQRVGNPVEDIIWRIRMGGCIVAVRNTLVHR